MALSPPSAAAVLISRSQAAPVLGAQSTASMSAQALAPGYRYALAQHCVVPFVQAGRAWVTAGPPVGPPGSDGAAAARAFVTLAQRHGRRAVFFGVEPSWAQAAQLTFLPLGEEYLWCPSTWCTGTRNERGIASQLRRARRRGVQIELAAAPSFGPAGEAELEVRRLTDSWQARHALPPMQFVVALSPPEGCSNHSLFVARSGGRLWAFAKVLAVGTQGVLIEHIVRHSAAPNGTAEALIDAVMTAHPDRQTVTLGLVPLAGHLPGPLRLARAAGQIFYNFAGLRAFKRKLRPHGQRPLGLAYAGRQGAWGHAWALYAVLRAFAGGDLTLFGLQLLLRGPKALLVAMACALPLWTLGLSLLPTAQWFPSPWVQDAWVLFDVLLFLGLCGCLWRPTPRRYGILAAVVALDTATTLVEALMYPGPQTAVGLMLHGLGVLAPLMSALMLWGAWRRACALAHTPGGGRL